MTAKKPPVEVDDVVVLLLGAPTTSRTLKGRIEGITRLEKLVFLLERETDFYQLLTETPDFTAHNFGPFSSKIYDAVDVLAAAGLVEDSARISSSTADSWEAKELIGNASGDPYATRDFSLTEKGHRYYAALIDELPKPTESMLSEFKQRFGGLPLRRLIRYVYQRYPEFTEKSIIRDEVLA